MAILATPPVDTGVFSFSELKKLGMQVYESSPVYTLIRMVCELEVNDEDVSIASSKYGVSLKVIEGDEVGYIPLRRGVSEDKETYRIGLFSATRDVEEYGVKRGQQKLFAY